MSSNLLSISFTLSILENSGCFNIFDNDEVGKLKCIKYSKLFPKARFLVWDKRIKYKDLNEIIVNNISLEKFKKFIDTSLKTAYEVSILSKLNIL
jgi:hypothetical protein